MYYKLFHFRLFLAILSNSNIWLLVPILFLVSLLIIIGGYSINAISSYFIGGYFINGYR